MTPTPTLLVAVALFWTLPASAAAYLYRRNGNSLEDLAGTLRHELARTVKGVTEAQHDPQTIEA